MSLGNREAILERLKHSLQLLACPADVQLNLLPDFVCKADELALGFDHWCGSILGLSGLTTEQTHSLASLNQQLDAITGLGANKWTDDAVHVAAEWQAIRGLAAQALKAFGWTIETPPSYAHEFVPGKKRS
jgi:hypothetical protein